MHIVEAHYKDIPTENILNVALYMRYLYMWNHSRDIEIMDTNKHTHRYIHICICRLWSTK